jgi:hypothetical protein
MKLAAIMVAVALGAAAGATALVGCGDSDTTVTGSEVRSTLAHLPGVRVELRDTGRFGDGTAIVAGRATSVASGAWVDFAVTLGSWAGKYQPVVPGDVGEWISCGGATVITGARGGRAGDLVATLESAAFDQAPEVYCED